MGPAAAPSRSGAAPVAPDPGAPAVSGQDRRRQRPGKPASGPAPADNDRSSPVSPVPRPPRGGAWAGSPAGLAVRRTGGYRHAGGAAQWDGEPPM